MTTPAAPAPSPARSGAAARATAISAFVLCAAASVIAIGLDVAVWSTGAPQPVAPGWTGALPGLALAIPGALLLSRLPWHPIAIAMLGYGAFWCLDGLAASWVDASLAFLPGAPGAAAAFWAYGRFGAWLLTAIPVILVLFPDGRLPRGAWRWVAVSSIVATSLMPLASMVAPAAELIAQEGEPVDPLLADLVTAPVELHLPPGSWPALLVIARVAMLLGLAASLAVVLHRRRGADEVRRAQLRWLLLAAIVVVLAVLGWFVQPGEAADVLFTIGVAAVSAAILIAVTRYRLYEIDGLLSWTLISALLVAAFAIADLLLAAGVGASLGAGPVALVAAAIVAAAYLPFRRRLRRAVARLVSGEREEPYEVMVGLAERLEAAETSEAQLAAVAATIRRAFLTPYVRIALERTSGGELAAEDGTADAAAVVAADPIRYRGRTIGTLAMAPARRPRFSARDRRLLDDVIRQAVAAVSASDANAELRDIRAGLVGAREDERRRMRRELHDGLGPMLAGITLRLDAAAGRIEADPDESRRLIDAAAADASRAVDEVRRIAQGLRPAALGELGLAGAIAQQCERLSAGSGLDVRTDVDLPEGLPAAVEVAVYRIVSEALTNVVRHADARHASVTARLGERGDTVELAVVDDGRGDARGVTDGRTDAAGAAGSGLRSQRQRAVELGGAWSMAPGADGGTEVRATLPVPAGTAASPVAATSDGTTERAA
ncbi:histidine kinase [Agromyces bauzanensis]